MDELEGRWEAVCKLSVSKQDRLEAALQQVVLTDNKGEVQRPDMPGKNIVYSCPCEMKQGMFISELEMCAKMHTELDYVYFCMF